MAANMAAKSLNNQDQKNIGILYSKLAIHGLINS